MPNMLKKILTSLTERNKPYTHYNVNYYRNKGTLRIKNQSIVILQCALDLTVSASIR